MMENDKVEFKESWRDEYLKVIASFANNDGGILYVGVKDNGDIVGVPQEDAKKLLQDIPNKIRSKLGITPQVIDERKDGKIVIRIDVTRSEQPVNFDGKFFRRSGSTTQELTGPELNSFLIEKTGRSWDSLPVEGTLEDLNFQTIEKWKTLLNKERVPYAVNESVETLLRKTKLLTLDGKLTRACVLLFGKEPQNYFISAYTRVGRFKDGTTILDSVDIKGNLLQQLDGTLEVIKKHLNVKFDTSVTELTLEGTRRREIWDYPLDALREALINALVHRDYADYTSPILIRIFDDEIWFSNPGKLLPPLTTDDLKKEAHDTVHRNPLLADAFYFAGLIEKWGTGTSKMVKLCTEQGLPEPVFSVKEAGLGSFTVQFFKDIYNEENLRRKGLSDRQIKGVVYVKERGIITNREYQEITGVSARTATRDLGLMVSLGILSRTSATGKGAAYVLTRHIHAKGATNAPYSRQQ